jgi:hypothetical protein
LPFRASVTPAVGVTLFLGCIGSSHSANVRQRAADYVRLLSILSCTLRAVHRSLSGRLQSVILLVLISLALGVCGSVAGAEAPRFVIGTQNVVRVRLIDREVELVASRAASAADARSAGCPSITLAWPFAIPPEITRQMYIRACASGMHELTVRLGFADAQSAAEFAALLERNLQP